MDWTSAEVIGSLAAGAATVLVFLLGLRFSRQIALSRRVEQIVPRAEVKQMMDKIEGDVRHDLARMEDRLDRVERQIGEQFGHVRADIRALSQQVSAALSRPDSRQREELAKEHEGRSTDDSKSTG